MTEKSIIIIGAGLAGLAAGCFAQMNGFTSRIFEHHSVPGGVVATWKRKGFTIDGGVHFLWNYKPGQPVYDLYRELGVFPANTIRELDTFRFINESNGYSLEIGSNLEAFIEEVRALSPADAWIIKDLVAGARAIRDAGLFDFGMEKPPELMGTVDQIKQAWALRSVLRYFSGKYAKSVAEYTQDIRYSWLQWVIQHIFLPEVPVWFAMMLLGSLSDGQIGLLEDGSHGLITSIVDHYHSLGGEITYRATIEKILIDHGRAVGVRLADGSEHYADYIISAADGHSTIFEMLDGRYLSEEMRDIYKEWQPISPMMMINFGVSREFAGEPPISVVSLDNPFTAGNTPVDMLVIRNFNYYKDCAPEGKSVIQVEFETDWDFWSGLHQEDRARYNDEKERIAAEALKHLEKVYPDISLQVEMTDVATPYTTWRYTRNYKGAYEGWTITPKALMTPVKRTLPGLDNFYMAGQWVMPGGGVPPCLFSGRHAIQLICYKEDKAFIAAAQQTVK